MPCITIRTRKTDRRTDLEGFGREISEQMGIDMERINIIADYFDESDAFMGGNPDQIIITLCVSETNGQAFVNRLMQTTAVLAEKYFARGDKCVSVMCNLVRSGHLFVNHQFI